MIKFQTTAWEWDLTNKGISFNEDSDFFSDKISKAFSFPFNIEVNENTAEYLGLINIDGVVSYQQRIYGYLIFDNDFYDGYIKINSIKGDKAELTIFYGKETLKVFDKKLTQLPFPVVLASPDLPTFALSQIDKSWPLATHNFVKVFREDLSSKSNYKLFDNFLNNTIFDDIEETWSFPINTNDEIEGEITAVNRNVMVPMTYLIEVLRVAFKTEALDIRGDFVNDTYNHKIVMVPKNFFEKFAISQFLNYSFSNYTSQITTNGQTFNIYQQIHTPTSIGSYSIKMKVNMNNVMAQSFSLKITQDGVILFEATSQNTQVNIDETLEINILNTTVFEDIYVEMRVLQQSGNIAAYNNFEFEYKEGMLNIFPTVYTLADFLPDITVRELTNRLKTWLNLKFDYTDNAVYINYLENYIANMVFADKSDTEQPEPFREPSAKNLFKLTYPNESTILVDKTGQTYNETDYTEEETEPIDIEVLPLEVKENFNVVTAIYPEDEEDLMFVLYNGTVAGENIAVNAIENRRLELQHIYDRHYTNWLRYRANSETYRDSFYMHYTEILNIKEGIFKYNKKHLMKSIKKKRVSEEFYKVDVESETF